MTYIYAIWLNTINKVNFIGNCCFGQLQPEIIDRLLAGILPNLAKAIMQRLAKASSHVRAEMANEAFASMSNFINRQHNSRLGVVVVVANGNTP
jgi:hypothetical protein